MSATTVFQWRVAALVWSASSACGAQPVATADDLFDDHACFACHSVQRSEVKKLGPYLIDIADKYRGKAEMPALLANKVRLGGGGAWGDAKTSVMPPNKVTPEEASALVAWVLQQK